MAKIGQNSLKKDVNDIKNFCFLHHTSRKSSLEYGPNHFLAKKSAQKFFRPKYGQNRQKWPRKGVIDIKNFCFLHHTGPKLYLEYGPILFLAKTSAQKN
jgi:hypothetical protein